MFFDCRCYGLAGDCQVSSTLGLERSCISGLIDLYGGMILIPVVAPILCHHCSQRRFYAQLMCCIPVRFCHLCLHTFHIVLTVVMILFHFKCVDLVDGLLTD